MHYTECSNGHVYDSDQYAVCPYCNQVKRAKRYRKDQSEPATMTPNVDRTWSAISPSAVPANRNQQTPDSSPTMAPGHVCGASEQEGHTIAPPAFRQSPVTEEKTVPVIRKRMEITPVVGWLVCIEGPEQGKDFRILAQINTIGRSPAMDICLQGDASISKENHARLAYDPKHNGFQLIPGLSVNPIYLNDEPVYTPTPLSAYDVMELGETKLVFVPFCSDRFTWNEGVKQVKRDGT